MSNDNPGVNTVALGQVHSPSQQCRHKFGSASFYCSVSYKRFFRYLFREIMKHGSIHEFLKCHLPHMPPSSPCMPPFTMHSPFAMHAPLCHTHPPLPCTPPCGQTDACENTTFPKLLLSMVMKTMLTKKE